MTTTKHKKKYIFLNILCTTVLFLGFLCFFSGRFYVATFGRLGFDSVLYTLFWPGRMGGICSWNDGGRGSMRGRA